MILGLLSEPSQKDAIIVTTIIRCSSEVILVNMLNGSLPMVCRSVSTFLRDSLLLKAGVSFSYTLGRSQDSMWHLWTAGSCLGLRGRFSVDFGLRIVFLRASQCYGESCEILASHKNLK